MIPWIYRYMSKWNLKNMLFFKKNIHKQMHKERTFEKYQSRKSNYHLGKSTAYCHPSLSVIFGFVSISHCSSAHCHWLEGRIYPSLDSSYTPFSSLQFRRSLGRRLLKRKLSRLRRKKLAFMHKIKIQCSYNLQAIIIIVILFQSLNTIQCNTN